MVFDDFLKNTLNAYKAMFSNDLDEDFWFVDDEIPVLEIDYQEDSEAEHIDNKCFFASELEKRNHLNLDENSNGNND